jgi:prepilin-type N-terminal cleavage/methylation domain-containing protein
MREERGETLIELLIALSIIGIAMVGIVGSMSTGIIVSATHRKQAVAGAAVMNYAEAVKQEALASLPSVGYKECAASSAYGSSYTAPSGYTKSPPSVAFWTGSVFQASCPATPTGVQRVTLQVASNDGRAKESVVVVVRNPCRVSDPVCT